MTNFNSWLMLQLIMATPRKPREAWGPVGRPTKYSKEYPELLIKHMSEGLSYESFAGLISVDTTTLYEWEKNNPEFSNAKKIAFQKNRLFWERAGNEGMYMGGQHNPFNATVWVFNMKNRFPKEWRDRKEVVADVQVTNVYENMTDEELKSKLEGLLNDP